jgi:hypothetical protein
LEWGIAVSVSKSTMQAAGRIEKFRPVQLLGAPFQWVGTAWCLRVALDMQPAWSTYINHAKKMADSRPEMLGSLFFRSVLSIREGVLFYKQFICPVIGHACPKEVRCPNSGQEGADFTMQVSALFD